MPKEGQIYSETNLIHLHPAVGGEVIPDVRDLAYIRELVGSQAVARFEAAIIAEQSQPDTIISIRSFKK